MTMIETCSISANATMSSNLPSGSALSRMIKSSTDDRRKTRASPAVVAELILCSSLSKLWMASISRGSPVAIRTSEAQAILLLPHIPGLLFRRRWNTAPGRTEKTTRINPTAPRYLTKRRLARKWYRPSMFEDDPGDREPQKRDAANVQMPHSGPHDQHREPGQSGARITKGDRREAASALPTE